MPTIHELMHVAVKGHITGTTIAFGSDRHYVQAVADIAGEKLPKFSPGTDLGSAHSRYWDDRLCQACGYPSLYIHEFTNFPLYEKLPLLIDKNTSQGSA